MSLNSSPLQDEQTISRRYKEYYKSQPYSFWTRYPTREGFTAHAEQHFLTYGPPRTVESMAGVVFQNAVRHGVLS